MGNTIAYESQGSPSGDDQTRYAHTTDPSARSSPKAPPLALQRKGSSFLEDPVISKMTERGEANITVGENASIGREGHDDNSKKVRYAVSEMQGWRSHMEDMHALNPTLSSNRQQAQLLNDHHLFAVFDGHGGDFASHFCGEHLVETLIEQKDWLTYLKLSEETSVSRNTRRKSVKGLQLLKSALTATFLELDEKLIVAQRARRLGQLSQLENLVQSLGGAIELDVFQKGTRDHEKIVNFDKVLPSSMPVNVPLERSGSTGVIVLITPHHFICANAGDSRAILSKKNEVLPLSFDHKPNNDVELTRVVKDGGFVRNGRVDGDLAVSRSFGDFGYKNCNEKNTVSLSNRSSEPKDHRVTVQPDILVHTRDPAKDEFVVLACDGIWDRLTNKDCSDIVRSLVHDEGETDVGLVCEEMIDAALELDSRDNMTCLLVVFPGANMGTPGEANNNTTGVMKRRQDRERAWGNDSTVAKRAHLRLEERRKKHREVLALQKASVPKRQPRRRSRTPEVRRRSRTPVGLRIVQGNLKPSISAGSSSAADKKQKANNHSPPINMSGRTRSNKSLRTQMNQS
mmetsp:Transcript_16388/g.35426  ORF Transcript_16388/g.35426 Transcript_16388/m.35426 type:complete len:571 (-) Transcript_16388:120-1832(-)